MDLELGKWIRKDLGLTQMRELDLNPLMYHPRHGNLCRRIVRFLLESTLCQSKYPDVFVRNEDEIIRSQLREKSDELAESKYQFERLLRQIENGERESLFLDEKLTCVTKIEDLLKSTSLAFADVAARSNFKLETIAQNIQEPAYLNNSDLRDLYSADDISKVEIADLTSRQITMAEDNHKELLKDANSINVAATDLLQTIQKRMIKFSKNNTSIKKLSINEMHALKVPECVNVTQEKDSDEKELMETYEKFSKKVADLDQQVSLMCDQYERRRQDIIEKYKNEKGKATTLLANVQKFEKIIIDAALE